MKLKPLGTNVLVEKLGSEEKTVSSIIQQKREIKLYILGVRRLSLKVRNMTLFLKAVY